MAKFKSVKGSQTGIGVKFDANGFYETDKPELIEKLSKMSFVERIDSPKVEAPEGDPAKAKKGGKV